MLKRVFKKEYVMLQTRFIWFGTGTSEPGNEPLASIKGGEFLGQLSDYYLLK
jgi:hypothetical protein